MTKTKVARVVTVVTPNCGPGATLNILSHFNFSGVLSNIGIYVIIPVSPVGKPRLKEFKYLARDHIASKYGSDFSSRCYY